MSLEDKIPLENQIPTPEEKRRDLEEDWDEASLAFLKICIHQIKEYPSMGILVEIPSRTPPQAIQHACVALAKKGWVTREERGGNQRDEFHTLLITPRDS